MIKYAKPAFFFCSSIWVDVVDEVSDAGRSKTP